MKIHAKVILWRREEPEYHAGRSEGKGKALVLAKGLVYALAGGGRAQSIQNSRRCL